MDLNLYFLFLISLSQINYFYVNITLHPQRILYTLIKSYIIIYDVCFLRSGIGICSYIFKLLYKHIRVLFQFKKVVS